MFDVRVVLGTGLVKTRLNFWQPREFLERHHRKLKGEPCP